MIMLVSTTEDNTLVDDTIDEKSLHNVDPLIQSLIDSDELDQKSVLSVSPQTNSTNENSKITSIRIFRRCTGIFYALLGSSLFTCSGFIIKQLRVDFFDALLARFLVQTTILTWFIWYKHYRIIHGSTKLILLQIIRMILASGGLLLFYSSYRFIPLPDLTTFRYTQVIWTTILAMLIFHERISLATIVAIVLTIVGVVCVAQPTFLFPKRSESMNTIDRQSRSIGLILALLCALSISGSIVLNKKLLVLKIPQSILMFHFSSLNLIILIIYQIYQRFVLELFTKQTMFAWRYFLAASVSLIQLLSSTITQKAIKLEHPSIVSVVQSSDILFAITLQNIFTNEKSNWLVILGSCLVTTSIFLVGGYKLWQDRTKSTSNENNNSKI